MSSIRLTYVALTVFASSVAGCIIVPTHFPEEEPYDKEELAFITQHGTTQDEIESALGAPKLRHETLWLYSEPWQGLGVAVCNIALPVGNLGCAYSDGQDHVALIIEFNNRGVAVNYRLRKGHGRCSHRDKYCVFERWVIRRAAVKPNTAIKHFVNPETGCSVFLYGNERLSNDDEIIRLDGRPIGPQPGLWSYYLFHLQFGRHEFLIPDADVSLQFDCSRRSVIFAQVSKRVDFGWKEKKYRFNVVDERIGRSEIERRRLAEVYFFDSDYDRTTAP